ncbi:MAG: TolB-like 6-bladed beta-propeller domain-containing protein, partial [Tannerella sp.]|nr:TolB-like 6-bladed beta-propeller domain-containing protein [Tannerella sp.]
AVCIDTLLFYCDRYDGQLITVVDIKNDRFVRRFLREGQGPDEALAPLRLSTDGKKLLVFQSRNDRLREYDISAIADTTRKTPFREYTFEGHPANVRKTAGGFVGIGMIEDGRYALYDKSGAAAGTVGQYPFRGPEMPAAERFFMYQGTLCTSPDGRYFAMGSSNCDNLEFYRVDGSEATTVKLYGTYDVEGHFDQHQLLLDDDCVMNYKGACGTERYCYMLYSGETFGPRRRQTTGGKMILVFDWEGAHVETLAFDETVFSFCVDADATLYALTYNTEEGFDIMRYKI